MSRAIPLEEQVRHVHDEIRAELPSVTRLSVAAYDPKTDLLKTYVNSTEGGSPLRRYEAILAEVPSLSELAESGRDRVIDDLSVFASSGSAHSKAISARFGSSYTRPLIDADRLRGFIFFDARSVGFFTPPVVQRLAVYAELMAVLLARSLFPANMLRSAARVAADMTLSRDPETGAHLDRMSRYARLVALERADEFELSDAFIEHLFVFAPLHDVGKVGIPDSVLLKPGRLTPAEFEIMKSHTVRGAEMINRLIETLDLPELAQSRLMHNIVLHHHEAWDGSGYPAGLAGEKIPIESRIVTVADVFDALTSERPYKAAWSPERAFEFLSEKSGTLFDPRCASALLENVDKVEEIRHRFLDEPEALLFREGYSTEL